MKPFIPQCSEHDMSQRSKALDCVTRRSTSGSSKSSKPFDHRKTSLPSQLVVAVRPHMKVLVFGGTDRGGGTTTGTATVMDEFADTTKADPPAIVDASARAAAPASVGSSPCGQGEQIQNVRAGHGAQGRAPEHESRLHIGGNCAQGLCQAPA